MKTSKPLPANGLPTSNFIVGYKDIFRRPAPSDRLSLISKMSKDIIIGEIAALNYRLKPKKSKTIDINFSTQRRELFNFCGRDQNMFNDYGRALDNVTGGKKSFIFTRQTCLFALEEIIQSNMSNVDGFRLSNENNWDLLLQYLLSVNDEITKIKDNDENEPIDFETLNPKLIPISELLLYVDPFFTVHRGWELMDFLTRQSKTKGYILEYFKSTYNLTIKEFIHELHRMWIANNNKSADLDFYYTLRENEKYVAFFNKFSEKFETTDTFKLLNIRKNPFFKRDKNNFMLLDISILLEKAYQQFINDFYFDFLRNKQLSNGSPFTMQDYKAIIGYFFEDYIEKNLRYSFNDHRNFVLRTFDQLKIKIDKKLIECGDVYLRNHNRIMLAEVKSTSIYDKEKYSGNISELYKSNRAKFFKDFGIDQLVNNIKSFKRNFTDIDVNIIEHQTLRIWPVIIFNERSLQTPFMAHIFNKRFSELMNGYDDKSNYVYPLTLLHVSDLENMEHILKSRPGKLFELLTYNFSQKYKIIPPFYNTLNRHDIRPNYTRVMKKARLLFE
ncbi:hypothetical protein FA048_12825 [Pedobacter polaris]|uniref:Restriction endonuclease n=1 Tax=Pedobacter polaris TaxID=2571273 RepID=A0A4U1CR10_9SPHI|nr:hypothetical protein [Pedobacter polaris]TKC08041.1 hypothetical protein FA048_12825 [Pedobacter polaris]